MKNIFATLVSLIAVTAAADTIDFWHVFYNEAKIYEYTDYHSIREIVFKADTLREKDHIIVRYFDDTPCLECSSSLSVTDTNNKILISARGKGTYEPIRFSLYKLVKLSRERAIQTFDIYYSENGEIARGKSLFRIRLR